MGLGWGCFCLNGRLITLGQDNSDGGYLTRCKASVVMPVMIDFEVRNGPGLAPLCNRNREATKGSLACTAQAGTPHF